MADETNESETETEPAPSLAEMAGVDKNTAVQAIAQMTAAFNAERNKHNAEMAALRDLVLKQQHELNKVSLAAGIGKNGNVAVVARNCNLCGASVEEGKRCPNPRHKHVKVNEVAFGTHHNRMQHFIARQV